MANQGAVSRPERSEKLPVGSTVTRSFDSIWVNRRALAPWLVAAVAFYALTVSLLFYSGTADFSTVPSVVRIGLISLMISGFVAVAVCLLIATIVAHRRVLLTDGKALRHSRPLWRMVARYAGHALLIILFPSLCIAFAAFFWFSLVGKIVADNPAVAGVVFVVYFLGAVWAAAWMTARVCLVLPAKASNVPGFGFGDAWRASKGSALRLMIGNFLVCLAFAPWFLEITRKGEWSQTRQAEYVFRGVLGEPLARLGMPDLGLSILQFTFDALMVVCLAAFLSHAFLILRHNTPELPNPETG